MLMIRRASSTAKLRRLHLVSKGSLRGLRDLGKGQDTSSMWPVVNIGTFHPLPDNLRLLL
jgi:hypothetical protein